MGILEQVRLKIRGWRARSNNVQVNVQTARMVEITQPLQSSRQEDGVPAELVPPDNNDAQDDGA